MNERFGVERKSTFGNVTAGIHMKGKADADLLLSLIEAGMRSGIDNDQVRAWRREVMNMRSRACRGDWGGWE